MAICNKEVVMNDKLLVTLIEVYRQLKIGTTDVKPLMVIITLVILHALLNISTLFV